jgi:hypothetical protein
MCRPDSGVARPLGPTRPRSDSVSATDTATGTVEERAQLYGDAWNSQDLDGRVARTDAYVDALAVQQAIGLLQ